ncbi:MULTISPECIES: hypothetical protein [unclassified Variovorax]|uniref:hypothetical protein n=1 Tax=unclassified Variovorax TaxID=663243 RepID=UPI001318FDEF|nr:MULTISPECIES: hypothetical protein [unclassified Variovorax]VTU42490.1 hypothetical protein H6P1_00204 [Variovorax sp. PBL-H6]VTU43895.1 hypothetical protein SRS16P1_00698 [Variovorax sp. SRS16]VTU43970.1 hypothetical protein E5P1_00691 [Variovorax sp. PBL-E5]
MNVTQPTPSQAAVVLKNFFRRKSIPVDLGTAQEAVALTRGYASWNVLAANEAPRGGKQRPGAAASKPLASATGDELWVVCGRLGGDTFDEQRSIWAPSGQIAAQRFQRALLEDDGRIDEGETYDQYDEYYSVLVNSKTLVGKLAGGRFELDADTLPEEHVAKEPANPQAPERSEKASESPSLADIEQWSAEVSALKADKEDALVVLKDRLEKAVDATGLLKAAKRMDGRDERAIEEDKGSPYVQLSYNFKLSNRFATELVVTLRDDTLAVYVRTWEMLDELDMSSNYQIFDERSGDFDTDAELPDKDEPLAVLLANALKEARGHKEMLQARYNVA